jgi:hypothetical protein
MRDQNSYINYQPNPGEVHSNKFTQEEFKDILSGESKLVLVGRIYYFNLLNNSRRIYEFGIVFNIKNTTHSIFHNENYDFNPKITVTQIY